MSSSVVRTQSTKLSKPLIRDKNELVCSQCGGNGYMKTAPNCYHTCLKCLGRGFLTKHLRQV